jgi:hypothetical protein
MKLPRSFLIGASFLFVLATAPAQTPGDGTGGTGGTGAGGTQMAPGTWGNQFVTTTGADETGTETTTNTLYAGGQGYTWGDDGIEGQGSPFTYTRTSPTQGTLTTPATDTTPGRTTTMDFTSPTEGTWNTVNEDGTGETTGQFRLGQFPQAARPVNTSVLAPVQQGQTLTLGFVVAGQGSTRVLVRAVGEGLAEFGVDDGVANPTIRMWHGEQTIARNENWGTHMALTDDDVGDFEGGADGINQQYGIEEVDADGFADIFRWTGAFPMIEDSTDAAVVARLPGGTYTVQVRGGTEAGEGEGEGVGEGANAGQVLVEVYFLD